LVNLWRIASCSSAPWLGAEDNSNDPADVKVSLFETICMLHKLAFAVLLIPRHVGSLSTVHLCYQPIPHSVGASVTNMVFCACAQVKGMDQHEDSVYKVAWSAADAWIYCSLSFDGR
jgi:hypothetical protein